MLLGYNHNITYKGSVFHIQTEDSGVRAPHIITLLYREGVILCSQKTSYADILKIDNLEAVVEDLMKEQHKDMLRRLKSGEFDTKAFGSTHKSETKIIEQKVESSAISPQQLPAPAVAVAKPEPIGVDLLFQETVQTGSQQSDIQQKPDETASKKQNSVSLDDAILNFFGASK